MEFAQLAQQINTSLMHPIDVNVFSLSIWLMVPVKHVKMDGNTVLEINAVSEHNVVTSVRHWLMESVSVWQDSEEILMDYVNQSPNNAQLTVPSVLTRTAVCATQVSFLKEVFVSQKSGVLKIVT